MGRDELVPVQVNYEGLRELAQALRETDRELLRELKGELYDAGEVVRDDATSRFEKYSAKTAAGFETRVRAGGQAKDIVVVAQSLTKTTGRRPDYGALQMSKALLPARAEKIGAFIDAVERDVAGLLHRHGF